MTSNATAARPAPGDDDERHRLTALEGLAALSLDALSSVAYGPEAILIVLVTAGAAALRLALPITIAIVVLLAVLVISYRQVIEAFPNGGGAYAVSKRHLGTRWSLLAAASLIVDYILNAAVGISAGIEALTSAFPGLYAARVWLCLAALAFITGANLWGVADSARLFIAPTVAFIVAIAAVIIVGLIRSHPVVPPVHSVAAATQTVGVLLILKAFASGCSALTGVEAIANSVPNFRKPRVRRAQHTEMWLGIILGGMLLGLAALIRKFDVARAARSLCWPRSPARASARAWCSTPSDNHPGPAGARGQHVVRWPAGPRQPARRGQLPAARLPPEGRAPGVPVRRGGPRPRGRGTADRVPGQHAGAGAAVRHQRGVVLDRAIRHGTANVVICRIRFRPTTWTVVSGS